MQPSSTTAAPRSPSFNYVLTDGIPFALVHLACFAAIWTGVHWTDLTLFIALYALRMFGITAGYHRYFAHRSYKTSRPFAFLLALIAQSSAQRGVLWWAANHRRHHRFSDTERDVHSPVRHGFWHSHFGWFFTAEQDRTDIDAVPDLARFPELRWLDRHPYMPAIVLGFVVWLAAGWSGLVVGFLWSTVALWHATFSINSVAHVLGRRRYLTADASRNNWWLALLTFGEGWHNNHHHFESAARQGFRWYEFDLSYYVLKALAAPGLVWDLRHPPKAVVRSEQRLRRAVVEHAAGQLAGSFHIEQIAAELHAMLAEKRASLNASVAELQAALAGLLDAWSRQLDERLEMARHDLDELVGTVHLPAMPTVAELRARASAMFVVTPSMNDIVERGRQILIENVLAEMFGQRAMVQANTRRNSSAARTRH